MNSRIYFFGYLFLFLVGCRVQGPPPRVLEGVTIAYVIDDLNLENPVKPRMLPAHLIKKIEANMTVRELVQLLGPGYQSKNEGIGYIYWVFDNQKRLHILPHQLDEKPKFRWQ